MCSPVGESVRWSVVLEPEVLRFAQDDNLYFHDDMEFLARREFCMM